MHRHGECGDADLSGGTRLTVIQIAFWQSMSVINMLTDLALVLFPVHVIVTLQMSIAKKVTILTFFGARTLSVAFLCFIEGSF